MINASFHLSLFQFWTAHGVRLMRIAIVLMCIAAVIWLGYEFWRLLFQTGVHGAADLWFRYDELQLWFDGHPVFDLPGVATYPPASFTLLWPFLGWMEFTSARWLWAATTVLSLVWLNRMFVVESLAQTDQEKTFVVLWSLATYATGATIGNGQLTVHIIPCLVASILIVSKGSTRWTGDLAAALLFTFALVKPSVSAPFFWILLFVGLRIRPALLVISFYIGLTLFASSFQTADTLYLMKAWLAKSSDVLLAIAPEFSNGNLHNMLTGSNNASWLPASSVLVLALLGIWTYWYRRVDIWVLMGVAALVSRFYTYHGWYDDTLILLPMIALFRLVKLSETSAEYKAVAAVLLGACLAVMMAPGGLYLLPTPWNKIYVAVQIVIWITMLVFLCANAHRMNRRPRTRTATTSPTWPW